MKIKIIFVIVCLTIFLCCVAPLTLMTTSPFIAGTSQIKNETCKPIIVVYPTWYVEGFSDTDIRWDLFSHLAVFAVYPLQDGSLETTDADRTLANVFDAAKARGKKVIISVGGAGEASKSFLSLTQNKDSQLKFIKSVTDYVAKYSLDGVDIDWEYWTFQHQLDKGGNDKDESLRLLNLLTQLRAALPKSVLLSVDIFAGDWLGPQYLPEIQDTVDFVNLMAYDFTGAWDESPIAHHSDYPTFKRALVDVKQRGFRTENLVVGMPAYAIEFVKGNNKAVKHISYRQFIDLAKSAGQLETSIKKGQLGNIYSETTALILQKVTWLNKQEYAGAMLFELSGDSLDPDLSLLAQLNAELRKGCQ